MQKLAKEVPQLNTLQKIGQPNRLYAVLLALFMLLLGVCGYLELRAAHTMGAEAERAYCIDSLYLTMTLSLAGHGPNATGRISAALRGLESLRASGDDDGAQTLAREWSGRSYHALLSTLGSLHQSELARASRFSALVKVSRKRLDASIIGFTSAGLFFSLVLWVTQARRGRESAAARSEIERLEQAALTDSLTSLGNHRAFYDDIEREMSRARRYGRPLSLILVDVDEFKVLNDSRGHKHGDEILTRISRIFSALRAEDRAYRIGGDEFAVLLPDTDVTSARTVVDRLQGRVRELVGPVTVSMGFGSMLRSHSGGDLYETADSALYAAKRRGRNAAVCFDDIREHTVVFSSRKAVALRRLLKTETLDIAFQPIWNLPGAHILGFEALARVPSSSGLSGPQEAFDVAERINRVAELDQLCIRKVLSAAASIPQDVFLFINVAPDSLAHPDFGPENWLKMLEASHLRPSQIVIEVTERRITNSDETLKTLRALRELGVSIALDDTGSGYAGLNLLTEMSFDFVKIDRVIVSRAEVNHRTRAVLAGIIAIAREAGSFVIAEGIEKVEQLDFLRKLEHERQHVSFAVHGAQGYLLGRPHIGDPSISTFQPYSRYLDPELSKTLMQNAG